MESSKMKRVAGFTLIELLVVIAIISLLSSIVFASLNDSREKARIAAGLQFSSSLSHVLGSEAAGGWNFDEGSGTSIIDDFSGYSNNGVITGATWSTDTPSKKGYSLNFDGNDSINLGLLGKESLQMGTGSITVEHWIKPSSFGNYRMLFMGGGGGGGNGYGTQLYNGNFRYVVASGSPVVQQIRSVNIGIKVGVWNHIVAVFDGENNYMQAFLNGVQKDKWPISSDPGDVQSTANFRIGSYDGGQWFFQGLIDTVRVYKRAVQEAEVKQLYAEGLKSHQDIVASN